MFQGEVSSMTNFNCLSEGKQSAIGSEASLPATEREARTAGRQLELIGG